MLIAVSRSVCQSCIPGLDTPIINATCIIIEDRSIKAAFESGGVDRLVGDEEVPSREAAARRSASHNVARASGEVAASAEQWYTRS